MQPDFDLLSQKVKKNHLRLTRQRKVIYEELARVDSHPRAEEIYEMVQDRIPHISFGTVYRNLKALKELGLVSEDKFGHNYSHFDANTSPHHHFTCLKCHRVYDVEDHRELDLVKVQFPDAGFKIHYSRVELYGTCPRCQKAAR
jgi:Fur family ferric uptake transcriptional regulator